MAAVGGAWGAYIGCLMWCPGVAALLTCKYLGRESLNSRAEVGKDPLRGYLLLNPDRLRNSGVWVRVANWTG